ncbi:MAG: hypothetical protein ACRCX2_02970 [Paraclostridium sp.]
MFKVIKKMFCEDGIYRIATMFKDELIGELTQTEHTIEIVTKNINKDFIPRGRYDIILGNQTIAHDVTIIDMVSIGDEVTFYIIR